MHSETSIIVARTYPSNRNQRKFIASFYAIVDNEQLNLSIVANNIHASFQEIYIPITARLILVQYYYSY